MKIKRNDIVTVIRGSQKGKTGKVLQLLTTKGRVVVEGLNMIKRHMRKTQDNPKGGIVEKEASISIANVKLYCPHCKKGVKILRVADGDRKIRKCKTCAHVIDA